MTSRVAGGGGFFSFLYRFYFIFIFSVTSLLCVRECVCVD